MNYETVWSFKTARFTVKLKIAEDRGYRYDGDDPTGEIQAKLDRGEYIAFDSCVAVALDGLEIASDCLGGSVYAADEVSEFWTAHRDPNPMNRNCSIMRARHPAGPMVSICHYFPDMIAQAIAEARSLLAGAPHMRAA